MADDIAFMPATRLLALYRSKQLSPVEVIEHTLRRLEIMRARSTRSCSMIPETALAMARADTLLTRGWPHLLGSRTIDPNQAWDEDAPVPGRLRANGAVFFRKTTTPNSAGKG